MQTEKVHLTRRLGTWLIRGTVGLLLGCAIGIVLVAAGLDLIPIRP